MEDPETGGRFIGEISGKYSHQAIEDLDPGKSKLGEWGTEQDKDGLPPVVKEQLRVCKREL
jgi:hypothetical protein